MMDSSIKIHSLNLVMGHAYLVENEHGMLLIDAGIPGQARRVQKLMRKIGRDDLQMIPNMNIEIIEQKQISYQEFFTRIFTLTHSLPQHNAFWIKERNRIVVKPGSNTRQIMQDTEIFGKDYVKITEFIFCDGQVYDLQLESTQYTYKQVYNIEFIFDISCAESDLLNELQEKKEVLQKKLNSLGEVNLVAIEKFEELNSRYKFLDEQRQDLVTSKDNLKRAIQKINRTSKEVFMEVFEKVQEEFKKNS